MSSFLDRRTPFSLAAAICIVLMIALGAAGFDQYFKTPLLESGDIAINAMQVDRAKHFAEIYGNYSRFEFSHPGPAFYYMYAAGEWLLHDLLGLVPTPGNAHLLASVFVQTFFFGLALALAAAHLPGRIWIGLSLLAAALYFGPLQTPFMSIWPPHVLLMPFLCFLVACASLASGRIEHALFVVLAGGFLFHGHVAQPLFVGSLAPLAFGLAAWRMHRDQPGQTWRQRLQPYRWQWWTSASLAALFALPLLIDLALGGSRSNVATILGRFYSNTGDSKTALQSFLYFVSFATPAQNQDELFTTLGPQVREFFGQNTGRVALWAGIFILGPCLGFFRLPRIPREERRFLLTAHLFVGVSVAVSVLWGIAQAGPMFQFNSYFYYAIFFFALVLALGWLDSLIRHPGNHALVVALCAIAAVISTWAFRLPRLSEADAGLPVKRAVEIALQNSDRGPRLLSFEHSSWPTVASLALDIQRRDIPFYLAPWWGFMFGHHRSLNRLGPAPEEVATVWWITNPGEGGYALSPSLSLFTTPAPLRPTGDEISFRGGANGFRYLVSGLTSGNIDYAHTDLPRMVLLFAPGTAEGDVQLAFDVKSAQSGNTPHPGVVSLNGRELARIMAGERAVHVVTVPRELWNSQPRARLELRFPEALAVRRYWRPRHEQWTAWSIWSIRVVPAVP